MAAAGSAAAGAVRPTPAVARDRSEADPDADWSLPGWVYRDPEFHAVELARIFRPSWQIVCHVNDLAIAGDWRVLDLLGESVVAVRGGDGIVRAFSNVCRHRAMRLVEGSAGCAARFVCPYHAWNYALDGRLVGVPMRDDYPALDLDATGLVPIQVEIWEGFVFIRIEDDGGPSVTAMMAPFAAEIALYRFSQLATISQVRVRTRLVNWKNVGDNYADNLHIPVAHAGLTRLFGKSYAIEADGFVDRMTGALVDRPSDNWSERFYQRYLPSADHLPASHRRRWVYYRLWPNTAFDLYPDQVDFMQWLPVSPTQSILREMAFALPDRRRTMRAVRYANSRINRTVNAEDSWLIGRVQQGMASSSYEQGPIGSSEVCLRNFAARVRRIIPQARSPRAPAPGWSAG